MRINKQFFKKYQKPILWLANSFIGKYLFQFEKMGHELRKGEKIDRIIPNSIRYKNKDNSYTEQFFGRNEYALKLAPLVWWLPIELITEGFNGGKALLRPAYQLVLITLAFRLSKELPFLALASTDFYPDADPETTSVDGVVGNQPGDTTWDILHDSETGTYANSNNAGDGVAAITLYKGTSWYVLRRGFFLFDTSSLDDAEAINSATFNLYGQSKKDELEISPTINVYSSNPASNTNIVTADYNQVGTTAFCDTAITYANWSLTGYNVFTLNSTGIAAISKIGITKFGIREATYDVPDIEPTTSKTNSTSETRPWMSESVTKKPKLTVTYVTADSSPFFGCNF